MGAQAITESLSDWLIHHDSPSQLSQHTYAVSRGANMLYTGDVRRMSSSSDYADLPLTLSSDPHNDDSLHGADSLEELLGSDGDVYDEHDDFTYIRDQINTATDITSSPAAGPASFSRQSSDNFYDEAVVYETTPILTSLRENDDDYRPVAPPRPPETLLLSDCNAPGPEHYRESQIYEPVDITPSSQDKPTEKERSEVQFRKVETVENVLTEVEETSSQVVTQFATIENVDTCADTTKVAVATLCYRPAETITGSISVRRQAKLIGQNTAKLSDTKHASPSSRISNVNIATINTSKPTSSPVCPNVLDPSGGEPITREASRSQLKHIRVVSKLKLRVEACYCLTHTKRCFSL